MPTRAELMQELSRRGLLGEYQKRLKQQQPNPLAQAAVQDLNVISGMAQMASKPWEIAANFFAGGVEAEALGQEQEPIVSKKTIAELPAGPGMGNVIANLVAPTGGLPAGQFIAAGATAKKEFEKHPVLFPIEAALTAVPFAKGISGISKMGAARTVAREAALEVERVGQAAAKEAFDKARVAAEKQATFEAEQVARRQALAEHTALWEQNQDVGRQLSEDWASRVVDEYTVRARNIDIVREQAPFIAKSLNEEAARQGKSLISMTRSDIRRLAEQVAIENQSRKMFPFSPVPRENPVTLKELFAAIPERAITGGKAMGQVTADDVVESFIGGMGKVDTPPFRYPELPAPPVKVGGRFVEGVMGEGFVMTPRKLTSARIVKTGEEILPSGVRQVTRKVVGPRGPRKAALEMRPQNRPAISNVAPSSEAEGINAAGQMTFDAAPVTAQVVVPEAGSTVFKSGFIPRMFNRVSKMAASAPAKTFVATARRVIEDWHGFAGRELQVLRDTGLHKLPRTARVNVMHELAGKVTNDPLAKAAAGRIRPILDRFAGTIERLGIMVQNEDGTLRPWSRRLDYAPLILKPEIADALYDDVIRASAQARRAVGESVSDEAIERAITSLHERGQLKLSRSTQQAVDYLIATNRAKDAGGAFALIGRKGFKDKYRFFGNVDAARTANMPLSFYEDDAARAVTEYIYGASRRIAEARHFGANSERVEMLLKAMNKIDNAEAKYFTQVADIYFGLADRRFLAAEPGLKNLYDLYTNFSVATKIGLGTATIPNLTQFAISTVPALGYMNFAKGALKVVFDPAYRAQLRSSGALLQESMQKLIQHEFQGKAGDVTTFIMKPFTGANKVQKYLAAATMDNAWDDIVRAATTASDPSHERALRVLGRMGINPSEAGSREAKTRAVFRFAADSQLQRSVIDEPMILNLPAVRPFLLFKRFGVRQTLFMKDWVYDEVKAGNVMPLLRLASAGYMGGEFVKWGKDNLREFLRGREVFRAEDGTWKDAVRTFAEVGSLGLLTDLTRFDGVLPEELYDSVIDNAIFAVTPLPISDASRLAKLAKAGRDVPRLGMAAGGRRFLVESMQALGGTIVSNVWDRAKSQAQIYQEVVSRRNRTQDQINKSYIKFDFDTAIDLFARWNAMFPQYPVSLPDVDKFMDLYQNDLRRKEVIPNEDQFLVP